MNFPHPPLPLQERVGGALYDYDHLGATCRRDFVALLPDDFSRDWARVLDYGSGAGRTLRSFAPEAEQAEEFWACDIDAASIQWMEANLCPQGTSGPARVATPVPTIVVSICRYAPASVTLADARRKPQERVGEFDREDVGVVSADSVPTPGLRR